MAAPGGLRVAALVKQIPAFEAMTLGPDGRLVRDGLPLELSAYCRRAVAQGVMLAEAGGGTCTAITLGPPSAEDVLREAVAGGCAEGVLVSDPAFAGSDTLATARALAAAVAHAGPFDLLLLGRNSVDADTGQVPPQLAELLDLPFATGVRSLEWTGPRTLRVRCEHDDEWVVKELDLPAVLSVAERLCDPCKQPPEARAAVPAERIRVLTAADLGPGPWGAAASPTSVGAVRVLEVERAGRRLTGPVADQVDEAVRLLSERGALAGTDPGDTGPAVGPPVVAPERTVAVLLEADRARSARALLGAAAQLAAAAAARVVALSPPEPDAAALGSWGADEVVVLEGSDVEADWSRAVSRWLATDAAALPATMLLAPGTPWGREVAARLAAATGSGLTGDAVALEVDGDRLVAWKPAFGGRTLVEIRCGSPLQMATVRPGVLPLGPSRHPATVPVRSWPVERDGRLRVVGREREDDSDRMARAAVVIGIGQGVDPARYDELEELRAVLGAELAATRKVTDQGWLPRARQLGITGHTIAPRLFVSIGASGKFNHTVGVRQAGTILAVNPDPEAPIWAWADVGITAGWEAAVPALVARLRRDAEPLDRARTATVEEER